MIKVNDSVEVLPNHIFRDLTGFVGTVLQLLPADLYIVDFSCRLGSKTRLDTEILVADKWIIQGEFLRVVESPSDIIIAELEDKIADLEDGLVVTRSCLAVSEEMREKQFELIEKLVIEIDKLKADLYSKGY